MDLSPLSELLRIFVCLFIFYLRRELCDAAIPKKLSSFLHCFNSPFLLFFPIFYLCFVMHCTNTLRLDFIFNIWLCARKIKFVSIFLREAPTLSANAGAAVTRNHMFQEYTWMAPLDGGGGCFYLAVNSPSFLFKYRPFHKTLPRPSASINRI